MVLICKRFHLFVISQSCVIPVKRLHYVNYMCVFHINSRNGLYLVNMDSVREVINEVLESYSIDVDASNTDNFAYAFDNFLKSQGFQKKEGKF